ncbi:hypothetical protein L9F63_000005, partial [Diploptera punctata]
CTSCERSLNYATKMARMLQSSTCEGRIGSEISICPVRRMWSKLAIIRWTLWSS